MALELHRSLHRAILLMQRKMRSIRLLLPSELSAVESIALSYLSTDTNRTATDLVALLGLSKAKVSRLLSDLASGGYLTSEAAQSDKRSRRLMFTERGLQFLENVDQLNNQISQTGCALLSPSEYSRLVELFHQLNNGLGAPPEPVRKGLTRFAPEQSRIVVITGMLGPNYMETGYSLSQYQLLLELFRQHPSTGFSELCEALPESTTKLSRLISEFATTKKIEKIVCPYDKRSREYRFTPTGLQEFESLETAIAEKLKRATELLRNSEIEELVNLLELIDRAPLPTPAATGFRLSVCKTESERKQARAFLVEQLVRQKMHLQLEEHILPSSGFCCIGLCHDEVLSLLEVQREGSRGLIKNFVLSPKIQNRQRETEIFEDSVDLAFDNAGVKELMGSVGSFSTTPRSESKYSVQEVPGAILLRPLTLRGNF